jgi:peptidoglycan/LPS O-acetylase OafA/YrhL
MRTVAVYLVLLFHAGVPLLGGGFIGVDVFFVLSGFLVSNVILSEIDKTGTLQIGQFYARRVRRLLPAALVVIVATSVAFVLIASISRRLPMVGDAQSALLYVANWRFAIQSSDYFAAGVQESPFLHFWSLAVEEQFYLLFPLLLLGLYKASRHRSWLLVSGLSALMMLSVGAQLYWAQVDTSRAYYGTDARLYQLLAGAVLAVVLRKSGHLFTARAGRLAAWIGLGGLLVLASGLIGLSPSIRGIGATVVSGLLIAGVMIGVDSPVARMLARPVPVFLGKISYGTYLWHWPVILILAKVVSVGPWTVAVIATVLATGLAAASYEVLEMPIRKSALLAGFRWKTAVVGVAASALVAVTVVPWFLEQDRKPALLASQFGVPVASTVSADSEEMPKDIDWAKLGETTMPRANTCSPDDVSKCIVVEGSGPTVAVVGDSQVLMLQDMFEKIAQDNDLTLAVNALPGCMWQETLVNTRRPQADQERCAAARVGWFEEALPKLDADVVILVSRPYDGDGWDHTIKRRDGKEQSLHQLTLDGTREALADLEKVVPRILLVNKVVVPDSFDPLDCLSSADHPASCAVSMPSGASPTDAFYVTAATESDAVSVVDLNPAFCPDAPTCRAIVDGEVVWLNSQHLMPDYATSRADQAWKLIRQTGVLDAGP